MYFISISFDNGFLLSIIAINLTLIGLTSLAETRRVLGVDYGKFLINQAYVFWRIKFKHFIISFATINILSAVSLLFTHHKVVLLFTSSFLLISMILLLIYFISSILFVNNNVSEQIYLYTLSNLYTSINATNREHSYFDTVLDVSDGAPTKKKVVSDAYNYFNIDNFELCISAVLDYIDHNHYKPIDEIHKLIEKLVSKKTIIERDEKVEIFHGLLEGLYDTEPKFSRNLNKEYFKNIK